MEVSGKEKKSRAEQPIKQICNIAYQHGLSEGYLDSLLEIILEPNGIDQNSLDRIIAHLFPVDRVSDGLLYKVVASLGQGAGKPSAQVQASLLKWLTMLYDVLANRKILSGLYGTLFNLIDMMSLR